MRVAIIGGGASGMITAYLLNKKGYHVTVFERQPILGGHIRTLNKNVISDKFTQGQFLEAGVIEFPNVFFNFLNLMKELNMELEPINIGSALFLKNGDYYLSSLDIEKNFTGFKRVKEYLKLDALYLQSLGLWIKTRLSQFQNLHNQPMSNYLKSASLGDCWMELLTMYSYTTPFELVDNFPAEIGIPVLRDYVFVPWYRLKGGVYSYIEKIIDQFQGDILLDVQVTKITRNDNLVSITLADGSTRDFDKVVLATPPDQVLKLLADPTPAELKRFSAWQPNQGQTIIHTDTSMYTRYGIHYLSEFDFMQGDQGWGYNAWLNQLCGITSETQYSLAFNLESLIAKEAIIHTQDHQASLYCVEAFAHRNEVIATNGINNTYHVGAYLGDGLHEGATTSAMRVAELIG